MESDKPRSRAKEELNSKQDYALAEDFYDSETYEQEVEVKKEPQKKKKEPQKKEKSQKKKTNNFWIVRIFILTFFLSAVFSVITETVLSGGNLFVSFLLLLILLIINIVFDVIGTAVAACDIEPFISKASRKIKSATVAIKLLKNADKVSNFCNDVVGDICGIISGACAGTIVLILATEGGGDNFVLSIVFSAIISALTVGGKAIGKKLGITKSHEIVGNVAKMLSVFKK